MNFIKDTIILLYDKELMHNQINTIFDEKIKEMGQQGYVKGFIISIFMKVYVLQISILSNKVFFS